METPDMQHRTRKQAEKLVAAAKDNGLMLGTAESCTAGALVHTLTDAPDASQAVGVGFVVYAKQSKSHILGVPEEVIAQHTAVSAEVATAMAEGAVNKSPADLVMAVTGVAGPEPDEDGNPVGLVYVAVSRRGHKTLVEKLELEGDKNDICNAAIDAALRLALRCVA
jgi:nicotinamide-nucleotide amidase